MSLRRGAAQRGFSLVDLLVACSVAGILATVALPSQQGSLLKSRRADAVAALMQLQARQESFRALHGLYGSDLSALKTASLSVQGWYAVTLHGTGPDGFSASATALPGGPQSRDGACATLTLTVRDGFADYGPSLKCWNR